MEITRKMAEFVVNTRFEDIPAHSIEMAKLGLMDWLSVTLIAHAEPLAHILNDLDQFLGGNDQATVIGKGKKTTVLNAALINGSVSHALDYDDVNFQLIGHPSVPVVPAILALGEWKGISGKMLLLAYILGVEAEARISLGVRESHYWDGWHATSTLGTFGSAVGCSKILGLDVEKTVFALGIAGTQAAGLRQVFGTMCKPFHAGKAAMNGLLAALLAERGFTSSLEMLEGELGFSAVMASKRQPEKMIQNLGNPFIIDDIIFKSHASCFETHSAIDVALGLREKYTLDVNQVEQIDLIVSNMCIDVARIKVPKTGLEGKFSIPYCTAVALLFGEADITKFTDEMVQREDLRNLAAKVSVKNDPAYKTHQAEMKVLTLDGQILVHEADTLVINADREYRRQVVEKKFDALVSMVLGNEKKEIIFQCIKEIENLEDIRQLMSLMDLPSR